MLEIVVHKTTNDSLQYNQKIYKFQILYHYYPPLFQQNPLNYLLEL